ncbi:hypothetical protein FQR65_LT09968 [Abscondita terminalis]|nr:hypothetical protein FQR65_LT09968 [Abscondita terminalis]
MALNTTLFLILSFFVVNIISDEYDIINQFKDHIDECIKEIQIDRGMVVSFFKNGAFKEDKNLKCFLYCLHVKIKFVNENGVANVGEMKNVILPIAVDKAKTEAVIEKCSKIKENDKCETSFEIDKCLRSQ